MIVLILIFVGNIFVCGSETLNVLLYRQVILHLDEEQQSEPIFDLLTTMILLLINKLIYNFIFRLYEAYTNSSSYRIIVQLDSLIYDKLLRTSLFANVSEGSLINFIQIDAEAFAYQFRVIAAFNFLLNSSGYHIALVILHRLPFLRGAVILIFPIFLRCVFLVVYYFMLPVRLC